MQQDKGRVPTTGTLGFRASKENKRLIHLSWDPGSVCQTIELARRESGWQMGHSVGGES